MGKIEKNGVYWEKAPTLLCCTCRNKSCKERRFNGFVRRDIKLPYSDIEGCGNFDGVETKLLNNN